MEATVPAGLTSPLSPDVPVFNPECLGCRALLAVLQAQAAQIAALTARIEQLEARLNQNSANSSRPPSCDRPVAPKPPPAPRLGRRQGGQPGHRGAHRELKPLECVAEVVEQVPTHCAHCRAPLPAGQTQADPPPLRHQVTELPSLVCVTTEYRLHARTCPACCRRTWAELPAGVPRGAVGPRLQAVGSLLTGGYGLSRRATQELLRDLLGEELSLGTLCSLEASTAAALSAPYRKSPKPWRRRRR